MLEAAFFVIQVPTPLLVQFLNSNVKFNRGLAHNSVYFLRQLVPLKRLVVSLRLDRLFAEVDAHTVFIHTQHFHHLLLADL